MKRLHILLAALDFGSCAVIMWIHNSRQLYTGVICKGMNAVTVIKISHNVVLMATRPSQCS
jgi:hypothetical protein